MVNLRKDFEDLIFKLVEYSRNDDISWYIKYKGLENKKYSPKKTVRFESEFRNLVLKMLTDCIKNDMSWYIEYKLIEERKERKEKLNKLNNYE